MERVTLDQLSTKATVAPNLPEAGFPSRQQRLQRWSELLARERVVPDGHLQAGGVLGPRPHLLPAVGPAGSPAVIKAMRAVLPKQVPVMVTGPPSVYRPPPPATLALRGSKISPGSGRPDGLGGKVGSCTVGVGLGAVGSGSMSSSAARKRPL